MAELIDTKRDSKGQQYDNAELPRTLLDSLNEMRYKGEHCDVFLRVEGKIFPAHRLVLAASSSYFRAMFSRSSSFSEAVNSEVCLKGVDNRAVGQVLDYFYTGRLQFTHSNLENVLVLANLWDVPFLLCAIEDYLRRELLVSNCLSIQFLVNKHQSFSSSFHDFVDKFILNNFWDISHQQEFLLLSVEQLVEILRQDCLRVKSEEMVFEAALRWLKHEPCTRKHFLTEVFREVRFGLLPSPYLTDRVLREELVQFDSKCRDSVLQVLQFGCNKDLDLLSKKRYSEALYVFCGSMNYTCTELNRKCRKLDLQSVQYFDFAMDNTHPKDFSPIFISSCHVVSLDQFIYFIRIGKQNVVKRFDRSSMEWADPPAVSLSSENVECSDHDSTYSISCTCQQFIYIVGGKCYRRLDTASNLWQMLPFPSHEHYRPGVCSIGNDIYVIAGCDKFSQEATNHVERFDTVNQTWKMLLPLPTARWGAGATVMNNMIYVVGG